MKLRIAWIGKTKTAAIQSLTEDYLKRLRPYGEVTSAPLKDEAGLLKLAGRDGRGPKARLVIVDSRGQQLSSEELAAFLRNHQNQNPLALVFAVGGANGFAPDTLRQADFTLSLGKMTLAHELARVVVLEQLYRAFTILKGHPYHLGH